MPSLNCTLDWADGSDSGDLRARDTSGRICLIGTMRLDCDLLRYASIDTVIGHDGRRRIEFTVPAVAPTVAIAGLTGDPR